MDDAPEQDPGGTEDWIPAPMRGATGATQAAAEAVPAWPEPPGRLAERAVGDEPAAEQETPNEPATPPAAEGGRFSVTADRIRALEQRLGDRLRQLEADSAQAAGRLEELEQGSAGSSAALDGVGSVQNALTERQEQFIGRQEEIAKRQLQFDDEQQRLGDRIEALGDRLAARGDELGKISERFGAFERRLGEVEERIAEGEQRLAAENDRVTEQAIGAQKAAAAFEEQTQIVLEEFRERLGIQSDRLAEAEQAARERLGVVENGFDAGLAGLRREIDAGVLREQRLSEELQTLNDALTVKLGELGARVGELGARVAELADRPPTASSAPSPAASSSVPAGPPAAVAALRSSLDQASFEELRATGLSVTQAARFIGFRGALGRPLKEDDIDEIAGLQGELRERLRGMIDQQA